MRHDLPQIKKGDTGSTVAIAQRLLILYGHKGVGAVDGIFGPGTESAVKEFQSFQNLQSKDGVVGALTWSKLAHPAGVA